MACRSVQCRSAHPRQARQQAGTSSRVSEVSRRYKAAALAYVGDAAWELQARARAAASERSAEQVRERASCLVTAEAQACALAAARERNVLSERLEAVARWARNAGMPSRKSAPARLKRTAVGMEVYREATALEAVVGLLHLEGEHALIEELADAAEL